MTIHAKVQWVQNHCILGAEKIGKWFRVRGSEFKHLVLFDNGLFDKICDNVKYLISEKRGIADSINHNFGKSVVLQIVLIIILGKSELIRLIIYQLKKCWLLIML